MKRVEALARGLRVLNAVETSAGASLHELHRKTGLAKATLLRALRTLEDARFIARRLADGAYMPSRQTVGRRLPARWLSLVEAAGPSLERLGAAIPWPTDLGVRDGTSMLVLESNRRLSPIQVNRKALGVRPHMLWSAMGRAYLAYCPEVEREEILATLRASSAPEDRIARNKRRIDKLLAQTRAQGYGVRDARYGVLDLGAPRRVSAIAVPVPQGDAVIASVNCVWLADALSERQVVQRHMEALVAAATDIARRVAR